LHSDVKHSECDLTSQNANCQRRFLVAREHIDKVDLSGNKSSDREDEECDVSEELVVEELNPFSRDDLEQYSLS